jgi:ATP-dependent Clp protease ATP-binding subunit ClpX
VDEKNLLQYISAHDVKSFGLIPELIGRLPVISYLNPLDRSALKDILTKPKNALVKQYKSLFDMENVDLTFTEDAIDFIVEKAVEYKLGARGLRSICEAILIDAMFDIPSNDKEKSMKIDAQYAESKFFKSKISKLKVA